MFVDQFELNLDDIFFDPPPFDLFDLFDAEQPHPTEVVEHRETTTLISGDTSSPPSSCPDDVSARIRELEQLLMEEEEGNGEDEESSHNPPSPPSLSPSPPLVPVVVDHKDSTGNCSSKSVDEEIKDEPVSKKQIRQLKNRDAALRSRERKKMYVKDLEMKSRYLESECRRLGRLLNSCYAENHMLRVSLHTKSLASIAESAVLLLESLLLGSLLWLLLVQVCLLPPQHQVVVQTRALEEVRQLNVNARPRQPEGKGRSELIQSSILSKSCRGSRTKMKMSAPSLGGLSSITSLVAVSI